MNTEYEDQESHEKLTVGESRPHLNGEEDDRRHAEKRRSGVQRRSGIGE